MAGRSNKLKVDATMMFDTGPFSMWHSIFFSGNALYQRFQLLRLVFNFQQYSLGKLLLLFD